MNDHAETNKKAFGLLAETYDSQPWQLNVTRILTENLQQRKGWLEAQWSEPRDGRTVKLLDYACGTGAASLALRPFVTQICGMDLSEEMVSRYNETMKKLELSQDAAHGLVLDLTNPSYNDMAEAKDKYDVAIISLALHHVSDSTLVLKALSKRLKADTGVLIVVDFLPFQHSHRKGHKHDMAHTIKQHGFTEEQMAQLYEEAGFSAFRFFQIPDRAKMGGDEQEGNNHRDMFIARGQV